MHRLPEFSDAMKRGMRAAMPTGPQTIDGWRVRNHMTQAEFARRIGCQASTVSRWENGWNMPQAHHRQAIEQLTGLRVRVAVRLV